MKSEKSASNEPEIIEMPAQKMAVIYARGVPEQVLPQVLPVLYGAVYALKFDLNKSGGSALEIRGLRTRYPDAHLVPLKEWTNVIGLPVPDDTDSLPQQVGAAEVKIETWKYGTVAQIIQRGPPGQEDNSAERLHRFIIDKGYEIIGVHEEEYLSLPGAGTPETIIRYRVREKK
jgi:hypothetical protein